jgi:hypothetical protein
LFRSFLFTKGSGVEQYVILNCTGDYTVQLAVSSLKCGQFGDRAVLFEELGHEARMLSGGSYVDYSRR